MNDSGEKIHLGGLSSRLMAEFTEAENARQLFNLRWIEDLRQYKGQYSSVIAKRLNDGKRSGVFHRITTSKIETMVGRLMDLLFQQDSKNWSIGPTPNPDIPEDVLMQELAPEIQERAQEILAAQMQDLQARNVIPDDMAMMKLHAMAVEEAFNSIDKGPAITRIAQERAQAMEDTIDDQLKDAWSNGHRRKGWSQYCRDVVHSSCLYGMGVLKGPLVERVAIKRFVSQRNPDDGTMAWSETVHSEELRPYYESVSVWDIFPDPSAIEPEQLRHVWQIHLYTDKDLLELANFPGFDSEAIRQYMRDNPEGDANMLPWEQQVREINADNKGAHTLRNRFRVYERWGYLSGKDLQDAGLEIDDYKLSQVYASNVWMLENVVIKAAINPLEGVDIPYFWFPYCNDETAFWPEGIASRMRDIQAGINASVRAMQDNAAASSGPIFGINMQALAPGEDPMDMRASKLFLFDKAGINLSQAFQAVSVPSCVEHNLLLIKFWQEAADEVTTPRFNSGDGRISGAGETASGLSMLMGAANISLKDRVKIFDDTVCAPFIRAMFRWNMQWNPDESIKGDFCVVASGSRSIITKEVRSQQIPAVMQMLGMPAFATYIKEEELLRVALEQTDLPAERILRTGEEAKEHEQQQILQAATAQAQANMAVLMQELEKAGASPEEVQQQLVAMLASAQLSANPANPANQAEAPAEAAMP